MSTYLSKYLLCTKKHVPIFSAVATVFKDSGVIHFECRSYSDSRFWSVEAVVLHLWNNVWMLLAQTYQSLLALQGPVVDAILAAGRAGSSHTQCPLMYQWHGTRYWGAAHGLAGIMHVLLHFPLNEEDADDVKGTLRYMIKGRFSSGNYPSSEGNARDRLIHWCHGAPGIAMTLCKAAQVCADFACTLSCNCILV